MHLLTVCEQNVNRSIVREAGGRPIGGGWGRRAPPGRNNISLVHPGSRVLAENKTHTQIKTNRRNDNCASPPAQWVTPAASCLSVHMSINLAYAVNQYKSAWINTNGSKYLRIHTDPYKSPWTHRTMQYHVLCCWYLVPGSWYLLPCTRCHVSGTAYQVSGTLNRSAGLMRI